MRRSSRTARPRIERPLVQRYEENRVVVPEDRLGPVAVVHVEIDDRDAAKPELELSVTRGDGGVREDAEAHRPVEERVMARWPDEREPAVLDGLDRTAGRKHGRLEGRRACIRVGVEQHVDLQPLDRSNVLGVVHAFELLPRRGAPGAEVRKALVEQGDPLRALDVGIVRRMEPLERRMADQLHVAASSKRRASRSIPSFLRT